MAVQVSQATYDALAARITEHEQARDSYENEFVKNRDLAADLGRVLADLEVAP